MALGEYKFIVPTTESNDDKKERLKTELILWKNITNAGR